MAKRNNTINPVQKYNKKKQKLDKEKMKNSRKIAILQNTSTIDTKIASLAQKELSGKINKSEIEELSQLQKQKTKLLEQKLKSADSHSKNNVLEDTDSFVPKDPLRSAFYDPIYNPFGAPPPGERYREVNEIEYERRIQNKHDFAGDNKKRSFTNQIEIENLTTIDENVLFEGLDPNNLPCFPKTPDYVEHTIDQKPHSPTYSPPSYILDMYKPSRELNKVEQTKENKPPRTDCYNTVSALLYTNEKNSISAEPILKDLKKESTKLMPSVILKQKRILASEIHHNKNTVTEENNVQENNTEKQGKFIGMESDALSPKKEVNAAPDLSLLFEYFSSSD